MPAPCPGREGGAGRVGFLLVAPGFAWFLLASDNPQIG